MMSVLYKRKRSPRTESHKSHQKYCQQNTINHLRVAKHERVSLSLRYFNPLKRDQLSLVYFCGKKTDILCRRV